jgi:hypothetical protein
MCSGSTSVLASLATRVFDAPDTIARCLAGLRIGGQRILRTEELVLLAKSLVPQARSHTKTDPAHLDDLLRRRREDCRCSPTLNGGPWCLSEIRRERCLQAEREATD